MVYFVVAATSWLMSFPMTLRAQVLLVAPKIVHALLTAAMDYSVWRLAEDAYGSMSTASNAAVSTSFCH